MLLEISTNVKATTSKIEKLLLENTLLSIKKYSNLQ